MDLRLRRPGGHGILPVEVEADMEEITSTRNPRVLLWRSLKERKARQESGLFLVEGRKSVEEALASGFAIDTLLVTAGEAPAADCPVCLLAEHVMAAVCDTKTPQGVAAVVRMRETQADGLRLVALDGVQDPGNVGTIIRTADAAGFDGVLLSQTCADPFSPKVLRATMGSVFHLPVEIAENLPERLRELQRRGRQVLSSELGGRPFGEWQGHSGGFVLVIGNEGNGVSQEVRSMADEHLTLPMRGRAESLNAAVAAGIMMYKLTE